MKYYEATISLEGRSDDRKDWRMENQSWNEKIQFLYETKYGCDVNIKIKNKEGEEVFQAHRFVLSMSSNVLEKIINSDVFKIPGDATIVFTNISPEVIDIFLNFVYTKNGKPRTSPHAIELFRIATKLNVPELKDIARKFIENNLDISSILDTYILAENNGLSDLKNRCALIIQNQTEEVINDRNLLTLDVHSLIAILEQPALRIKETELFKFIQKWLSDRKKNAIKAGCDNHEVRKKLTHCLVKRITFLSMTAEQFQEGPMKSRLLSKKDEQAILGHINSKSCLLDYPAGFNRQTRKYLDQTYSPKRISVVSKKKTPSPEQPKVEEVQPRKKLEKTSSTYRVDNEGDTPPPTIGLQRVHSVTPTRLKYLLPNERVLET